LHRRGFLTGIAGLFQALIGCFVVIPGARFVLDPLWSKRKTARFLRVAPLSAVTATKPVRVTVHADRWDAFTHHPPGAIGSVWLQRLNDQEGAPRVRCLHTTCPHLGCGIDHAADRSRFFCPCHASDFDENGKRLLGPAPRDMDDLPCRVTHPDDNGDRWIEVEYQDFQTGTPEQRAMV
jgi:nitrite reductase/ring-hydroxylating ferredoxin subunit